MDILGAIIYPPTPSPQGQCTYLAHCLGRDGAQGMAALGLLVSCSHGNLTSEPTPFHAHLGT